MNGTTIIPTMARALKIYEYIGSETKEHPRIVFGGDAWSCCVRHHKRCKACGDVINGHLAAAKCEFLDRAGDVVYGFCINADAMAYLREALDL